MPSLDEVAVVVPVGPGEQAWRALPASLTAFGESVFACVEEDTATEEVRAAGLVVQTSRPGRARQLNAGARASSRPWLWFLHADSRFDARVPAAVAGLPDHDCLAYFDLRFHDGPALMWLNALGAGLRSRLLGLPFGDQGLLMPRRVFEALGGFDESLPSAEDHALVWAARRAGVRLRALNAPLSTSARRYAQYGWWRVTARHLSLTWRQARDFSRCAGPDASLRGRADG